MEVIREYWWLFLLVIAIAILAYLLIRPRQRVRLTDSAPVRPHMAQSRPPEGRGLAGEHAAAASDVTGELLNARVHHKLDRLGKQGDDLCQIKGIGLPRLTEPHISVHGRLPRRADWPRPRECPRLGVSCNRPWSWHFSTSQEGQFQGRSEHQVWDEFNYRNAGNRQPRAERHGGVSPSEFGRRGPNAVPLQIHMMDADQWTEEDKAAAEALVEKVPTAELFLYPGSGHLFADPSSGDYNQEAAVLLKQRTLAFLDRVG